MRNKEQFLQLMGIERWRLRENATNFYYCVELGEGPIGLLIADAILQNEAEKNLVSAIAKATNQRFSAEIKCVDTVSFSPSLKVVILLGEKGAHYFKIDCPVIVTHSPATLLENAALKADTWRDIKKAMSLMA